MWLLEHLKIRNVLIAYVSSMNACQDSDGLEGTCFGLRDNSVFFTPALEYQFLHTCASTGPDTHLMSLQSPNGSTVD